MRDFVFKLQKNLKTQIMQTGRMRERIFKPSQNLILTHTTKKKKVELLDDGKSKAVVVR